jgi:hypothetical protein
VKLRVLAVLLCVLAQPPAALAQHGFWRPDERILITSFLNARGIATDHRHVWVATEFGLEIYDIDFKRWLPPLTIEDGYPVMERPGRIAYDQRDRVLWLLTDAQSLYAYSPTMQWWERRSTAELTPELREKLLRSSEQRDPAWAIVRNFIGRDASARSFPISAVEPAERNGTFWAATLGNNFSFGDTRNLSSETYTFGSISRGVSALAIDQRGNLYFGGDGQSARNGIARSDSTLQKWQQYESRIAEGPRNRVHAMAASSSRVYAGASDGLFVLRDERWLRMLDMEVHALAGTTGRMWLGGRGRLGWLDDSGSFSPLPEFPLQDVYALATRGDTLWVAASRGLFEYSGNALKQPLSSTAFGVAATDDGVIAVTSRGIISREAEGWLDVPGHASYDAIGRFISISAHGNRVWFGGVNGLAEWNTATNTWRHLRVPDDIPEGPIYDVVYQNGWLWLATPAGALGVQWK